MYFQSRSAARGRVSRSRSPPPDRFVRGANRPGRSRERGNEEKRVRRDSPPTRPPQQPPYTIRRRLVRTYDNGAVDTTYTVRFNDDWEGNSIRDLYNNLENMFADLIDAARLAVPNGTSGRVVIRHPHLDPIIVSMRPLDEMTVEAIMAKIENVLTSHEELTFSHSITIDFGIVDMPRGGCVNARKKSGRVYITHVPTALSRKTSIVEIKNLDNTCLARSIAVSWAKANIVGPDEWGALTQGMKGDKTLDKVLQVMKVPLWFYDDMKQNKRGYQDAFALSLCTLAEVNPRVPASFNDISKFEEVLNAGVYVVSTRASNKVLRIPNVDENGDNKQAIFIYHVDKDDHVGHFHAIVSITGFFNSSKFCKECHRPYNNAKKHPCESVCKVCTSDDCPKTDSPVSCRTCHFVCRSMACLKRHQTSKKGNKTQCEKWWRCTQCKKAVEVSKFKPEDHDCSERYCSTCCSMVQFDHLCHQRSNEYRDTSEYRHLYYDFECRQDSPHECKYGYSLDADRRCPSCQALPEQCPACKRCTNCNVASCGLPEHKPNYVVLQKVCNECENSPLTEICTNCGDRQKIYSGEKTLDDFGEYLFNERHSYYTVIAHNGRSYDFQFLLKYMISQGMNPSNIIYSGSKIMYMTLEKLHMRFIDSLNFLPMPLSNLPKAFDLKEMCKGWFPHYFNRIENQNYVGPYPPVECYGLDQMSSESRTEFLQWYDKQEGVFDFQKEMKAYCISDVTILREACIKFRRLMIDVTKSPVPEGETLDGSVDPFNHITIASVCMDIFKTKYHEEYYTVLLKNKVSGEEVEATGYCKNNVWMFEIDGVMHLPTDFEIISKQFSSSGIAQVPPHGYANDQFSKASINWLKWLEFNEGVHIQHGLNEGEHCVPGSKYKLDGFIPATHGRQKVALEFHGCVWHGCRTCNHGKHPYTKQSQAELFALTMKKMKFLKEKGYKYRCIWECQYEKLLENNAEMREFVQSLDIQSRLCARESFFGGRTNASKLHYKVAEGEKVKYVDFTSLYPFVNKYARYPTGHPTVITSDFQDFSSYFGMAKVKILAPRGLYHPVLPFRSDKLKFALCRNCAETENQTPCTCSVDERAFVGTWCTPEIDKALEKGYKILQIYEIYHWDSTTDYDRETGNGALFAEYINSFLKLKQEASGWPAWCLTEVDKQTYIRDYQKHEGILLDYEKIQKNPGLRSLAKLCLNSFWGKFGQRLDMQQTKFIDGSEAHVFFSMMHDPKINVSDFYIADTNSIILKYNSTEQAMGVDTRTNIFLASFTTCWARLELYNVLDRLGDRVIYYDTDSIFLVSKPGFWEPPTSDWLGGLTDELDGEYIIEFVSGGPKNYSYRTNTGKTVCKVRGFTLNYANSGKINFDIMRDMVVSKENVDPVDVVNPSKICRDSRHQTVYNRYENKKYRIVYTKRVIQDNLDTLPYGY